VIVTVEEHDAVFALRDLATAAGTDDFALRDLATAAGTDEGTVDVEASGLPVAIRFSVAPGTAVVEPLTDPNRLQAVRHTFWFAWYAFGGMIPDTEVFLESDHPG